jgi:hypothetical protein
VNGLATAFNSFAFEHASLSAVEWVTILAHKLVDIQPLIAGIRVPPRLDEINEDAARHWRRRCCREECGPPYFTTTRARPMF